MTLKGTFDPRKFTAEKLALIYSRILGFAPGYGVDLADIARMQELIDRLKREGVIE